MPTPINFFISYSHVDEPFKRELEKRLQILAEAFPDVSIWSDSRVHVGDTLNTAVDIALHQASIFIPLVSSEYLASHFCWKIEYSTACELRALGRLDIAPIIIRPCSWKATTLQELLCAPKDGKPITTWANTDEAWLDVEIALRAKVAAVAGRSAPMFASKPSTLLTLAPMPLVTLRASGCAEMLPPIEFTLGEELLREDYGDIQLFFNTNFTSRLIDDPVSECSANIESDRYDTLPPAARAFEINGVQQGANSILFRSFPLYLLRTHGAHHCRVSVRHARVNMSQLGPSAAFIRIAVQVKNQQGEWLTEGDVATNGEPATCKVRALRLTGRELQARLDDDNHRGETHLVENVPVPADLILSFYGLAGTDARNPLTPLLFGVRVASRCGVSIIASLYNVDAEKGSTARLIKTDVNGAWSTRTRAEAYRTTHTLLFDNDPYDAVAIAESYCVWRVTPGRSLEHDTISVLLKLMPSSDPTIGVRDAILTVNPFLAPMTIVTTASSTAPIPRFTTLFQAADLSTERTEWIISI